MANETRRMVITRAGEVASAKGAAETFNGSVVVTPLFGATEHMHASGALVTFEPCACSAWHTHPAGQTLIVTAGVGWIQEWDGPKREIRAGDVVWTPPGVSHIAVQEVVNGKAVDWLEKVPTTCTEPRSCDERNCKRARAPDQQA